MKVKALDPHLINIIAAGEIIDRPASIVKELVENSLDAGAKRIDIEVQKGGLQLIRIEDDGQGIAKEDLELAIQRHTTSKISTQEDLDGIQTLGFRGEALASICEVAKVQISSKTSDAEEGHQLIIEAGDVQSSSAVGRRQGTTIEVKDLFYQLPPRRKFLKSEKTENLHITRLIKRFLFSHPEVHLRLIQGKRTVLDSPGSQDLIEIASHLYDTKVAKGLVPVDFQGEILKVHGWVSTAQMNRADRNEQYTFVNTRGVGDPVIYYTINRAYEGTLQKGRHPYVCLHMELDPHLVDVNVHPQKHEVRFLDAQIIRRELLQALNQALLSSHATPNLPWKQAEEALKYRPQRKGEVEKLDLREELEQRREAVPPFQAEVRDASVSRFPEPESGSIINPMAQSKVETTQTTPIEETIQPPAATPFKTTLMETEEVRVVGQIHGTYIVVQTSSGFELIDQHVAHERVLYEKFLEQIAETGIQAQNLLLPETIKATLDQAQQFGQHTRTLAKLGIDIEAFGPDTFLVRAWPQALAEFHAETGYQHILQRLLEVIEQEGEPSFESLAEVMVASLSCEAAVVKNTLMPLEAMRHLIKQLKKATNPFHCPHGRPIILQYGLPDLERAFKRR